MLCYNDSRKGPNIMTEKKGFSSHDDDGNACCLGVVFSMVLILLAIFAAITDATMECTKRDLDVGFFFCAGH